MPSTSDPFSLTYANLATPVLSITSAGGTTNQVSQTISGTIDAADAGLIISIFDGTILLATTAPSGTGAWSKTVTLASSQGLHSLTAKATNAAGSVGASTPTVYTLDTIAPILAITSTGGTVNKISQTISGTIDAADAGLTISIFDGTTLLATTTAAGTGAWSKTVTLTSNQGIHALTARASDAAGNLGTSAAVAYTLQTTVFAQPGGTIISNFAVNAGGWSSEDKYPRHVADVNGDGYADIIGFGQAGTLVAFGSANGAFSAPVNAIANFGQAQGWSSDNAFHRQLVDVNHDGRADVVGFGIRGVLVSLAQSDGSFAAQTLGSTNFNQANGWSSEDAFTRTLADVNGDGFADVVGFGIAGTFVALGKGDGTFGGANFALANFGANQGWTSDNTFHRTVADVNGDGRADVIGFGIAGTLVALGQADGTFAAPTLAQANFGTNQGWSSQDAFARAVGDVNGDGKADVVGFGIAGTFVSYGQADGSFSAAAFDVANFGANQGWTSDNVLHRELADLNKDGRADIVGFGYNGVFAGTAFGG